MSPNPETKAVSTPPVPADPRHSPNPPAALPPPPGARSEQLSPWEKQAEAYLLARNWQKVLHSDGIHSSWYDGAVHERKPELKTVKTVEGRDGTSEVLLQWHSPPVPWGYSLDEAVALQQERESTPEGLRLAVVLKKKELAGLEEALLERETRPLGAPLTTSGSAKK